MVTPCSPPFRSHTITMTFRRQQYSRDITENNKLTQIRSCIECAPADHLIAPLVILFYSCLKSVIPLTDFLLHHLCLHSVGQRVIQHCTDGNKKYGKCEICEDGTYNSEPSNRETCQPCKSCAQANGTIMIEHGCSFYSQLN